MNILVHTSLRACVSLSIQWIPRPGNGITGPSGVCLYSFRVPIFPHPLSTQSETFPFSELVDFFFSKWLLIVLLPISFSYFLLLFFSLCDVSHHTVHHLFLVPISFFMSEAKYVSMSRKFSRISFPLNQKSS